MRGAIKFIMTSIGLVLIGIAVGAILLSTHLESFTRDRLATSLGRYYGAEAEIAGMRLLPLEQAIELTGVTVFNPEPFDHEAAIKCERLLLRPDWVTVFSARPEVKEVAIEGAEVLVRYDLGTGSNIGHLLEKAEELEQERARTGAERRIVIVRNCRSSDAKVLLTSNALLDIPFTLDIAPFVIDEISSDDPVPAWKTASLFLKTVLWETVTANGLFQPISERIKQELGED